MTTQWLSLLTRGSHSAGSGQQLQNCFPSFQNETAKLPCRRISGFPQAVQAALGLPRSPTRTLSREAGLPRLPAAQVVVRHVPSRGSRAAREFLAQTSAPKARASNPDCTIINNICASGAPLHTYPRSTFLFGCVVIILSYPLPPLLLNLPMFVLLILPLHWRT